MSVIRLKHITRATELALLAPRGTLARVRIAASFSSRLVGLLSRSALEPDEGLLLIPGGSIHTLGMRFAIDIVFLSAQFEVVEIHAHSPPSCWIWAPRRTALVLEVGAGIAARCGMVEGVCLSPIANTRSSPSVQP